MMLLWTLAACTGGAATIDALPCEDTGCEDTEPVDSGTGGPSGPHTIELHINEVMADNVSSLVQNDGSAPDWVELYNASDIDIDIDGFLLTDSFDEPDRAEIKGSLVVPAGGFVLLLADGGAAPGPEHLGFRLDNKGEQLGLYNPEGKAIDLLEFGEQAPDVALARAQDGVENSWEYVFLGTPGESNED